MLAQEIGHDEPDVLGDQRAAFLADVLAADEGRDRRRVRRRPADAVLLQGLHQRCFAEPRRRLREVLRRVEAEELELLPRRDIGERRDLLLGLVARFEVRPEESVEEDLPAVRAQDVARGVDVEARVLETRRRHLRRDRPLPDERVELQLVRLEEPLHAVGRPREVGRADRLVRLLCAFAPRLVVARSLERVGHAELRGDHVVRLPQRSLGHVQRVGPHVGDEADGGLAEGDALVELLREDHRPFHGVAELARCLLLKRRRRERRRRVARALARVDALDRVARVREGGAVFLGGPTVVDLELVTFVLDDLGGEGVAGVILERGLERPVLLRDERLDLALPIDDEPEGDGLDATGREPVPDLLPEERRHRVADEPIHDAASLLRVHEILVDLARVLEGLLDRRGRDLVEGHALQLRLRDVDDVRQVPGDRLALAVEVRREPHVRRRLGLPAEEAGLLLGVLGDDVLRLEGLEVDAELGLGQIPDVAERGLHFVPGTEHPF